jgi:hypothetical protein
MLHGMRMERREEYGQDKYTKVIQEKKEEINLLSLYIQPKLLGILIGSKFKVS